MVVDLIAISDLIGVIVMYTTPGTTLNLLTSFRPIGAYDPRVWRLKSIKETRGLVVDDAVAGTSLGDRFKYYLAVNTTLHGNLKNVNEHGELSDHNVGDAIISNIAVGIASTNYIRQDANYVLIRYYGPNKDGADHIHIYTHTIYAKIRDAVAFGKSSLLLDEFGNIHQYTQRMGNRDIFDTLVRGYGFVSMLMMNLSEGEIKVLSRNGNVYLLKYDYENNKIVELKRINTPHDHNIVQLNGDGVLTRFGRIVHDPPIHIGERKGYGDHVSGSILNNYSVNVYGFSEIKAVMYSINRYYRAYVSLDRTLYVNVMNNRLRDFRVVRGTEHVTQGVYLNGASTHRPIQ